VKTQIVQLETHDDYISVRDRMEWGQTTRVLLVWPLRGKILNRRLDLLLLKRHSEALGSQLALVTRDRDVRYHADRLDIPVYKSIRDAEQSRWLRPRRKRRKSKDLQIADLRKERHSKSDLEAIKKQAHPPSSRWLRHPVVRVSFFTLGVLSMLLVASLFIPSAEIYVTPDNVTDSSTISVSASPDNKTTDISGAVPTYWQSVIIEGRGNIPSSGETLIPRQAARGRVAFTNLTDNEIVIPASTVVSTQDDPPIRFKTREDVTIPTGSDGMLVWVDAIIPGDSGNVAGNEIIAIEGPLGLNLTVANPGPTSGGSHYTTAAPTESDYQKVYDQLLGSLQETALSDLEFRLESDDVLLSETPVIHQVLEEIVTPEIGQPADYLELTLRVEFQIPYTAGSDLYHLGRIVLDRQIPEDFTARPETLNISQLTVPVSSELGKATWKIKAGWKLGANLDESRAVSLVLGNTPEQAIQKLRNQMPITGIPEIRLTPEWWPSLPILPFRIKLVNVLETHPENQNTTLVTDGVQ
jgi:hypothetical protein